MKYLNFLTKYKGVYTRHLCTNKKLKKIFCFFIFVVVLLSCVTVFSGKIFYQNTSPSAPAGIYIISLSQQLHYGDYVIVLLPQDVPALNVKKGYPLLKKVQGFQGDKYTVHDDTLLLHGRSYPFIKKSGLPLQKSGDYVVPQDYFLFLNDPDISFDSRYIGPISKENIVKKVILLFPYSFNFKEVFNG